MISKQMLEQKESRVDELEDFFRKYYLNQILTAQAEGKKSIEVDFSLLDRYPNIADFLMNEPATALEEMRDAAKNVGSNEGEELEIRIFNIPQQCHKRIRDLRSAHIGKLIVVDGTVRRASDIRPEIYEAVFKCQSCDYLKTVEQINKQIKTPMFCDCMGDCGKHMGSCKGKFDFNPVSTKLRDMRYIVIEEPYEIVTGDKPGMITVYLKTSLTSTEMQRKTDPGARVRVYGVMRDIRRVVKGKPGTQLDVIIEANNVENAEIEWEEIDLTPEDERIIKELSADPDVYKKLTASIAPSIYGLEKVKEAIALQIFGGVPHKMPDGTRLRGDIHILLLGEPACLVGDERVVLGNGAIMKMESIGEKHLQNINIPVYLAQGYQRGIAKIFHKYDFQQVMEIITESGKSIKGTFNHPLLTKDGWKRLDELRLGDEVRTAIWIPCSIHSYVKTNWELDKNMGPQSKEIKIPRVVDEKLASVLGYLLADGWAQKYRVGAVFNYEELDLLPTMQSFFKELFDAEPRFNYKKTTKGMNTEMVFNYRALGSLLHFLRVKRVPDLIMNSRNSVVAAFLSWLYDGDGSAIPTGRGRRGIYYKAKDVELLRDMQVLFLRFGIHSRIYGNNLVIRQAGSIQKFVKSIGFNCKKKKIKIEKLAEEVGKLPRKRGGQWWERIVKIAYHLPETVYDIEVPKQNRFVANGIVSHNTAKSQILKLVSTIMPRGKYVSGRGTSAVGLTASVTKDEEFMGGWVLEAGAMVLTNKSLLSIDEFEKMSKEDQIALHESLEQQSFAHSFEMIIDDKIVKIGDFVENIFKTYPERIIEGVDCLILPINDLGRKIYTTDFKEIFPVNINRVSKHKAPDTLIKIRTQHGREIVVTPEHPCWVVRDGRITTIPAIEVKNCEFFPIPKKLPIDGKVQMFKLENNLTDKRIKKVSFPDHNGPELCKFIGYHISDGGYELNRGIKNGINFGNANKDLINDYINTTKKLFKISPYVQRVNDKQTSVRYVSVQLVDYLKQIDPMLLESDFKKRIPLELLNCKKEDMAKLIRALFDGDGTSVNVLRNGLRISLSTPNKELAKQVQDQLLRFEIRSSIQRDGLYYKVDISGQDNIKNFYNEIGFLSKKKSLRVSKYLSKDKTYRSVVNVVPNCALSLRSLFKKLRVAQRENIGYTLGKHNLYKKTLQKYVLLLNKKVNLLQKSLELLDRNPMLYSSKMREILDISRNELAKNMGLSSYLVGRWEESNDKIKIDMLRNHLRRLILRSLSSKQDLIELEKLAFGDIEWTKVTKVEPIKNTTDKWVYDVTVEPTRSFVSECLVLHNTISIAKASIVATLPSQTAVLAGANPKYSRFDRARPIGEQTDIPLTLLSRFDLKFVLRDIPDRELDEKMATHIMEARLRPDKVEPVISVQLLKKFIAYCRKNCSPEMTRDALEEMKNYYIKMRSMSTDETLAITLRQNEALMRLSEASARIRLSPVVTKDDAMRAIDIMSFSIRELAYDFDTGKIDIDRTEGIASSQRGKINLLLDLIIRMEKKFGKQISREELRIAARDEGVEESVTDELIERLKRDGTLYEPFQGFIARAR
ncbi:MAG TPA: LAGLIDADG family homing endonuclease [archaeon]|nr:LAGLIDADG family homing endonuclease [archaeon]